MELRDEGVQVVVASSAFSVDDQSAEELVMRVATDWTRPAESPVATFFHWPAWTSRERSPRCRDRTTMRRSLSASLARSSRTISGPLLLQPQISTCPLALVDPIPLPFRMTVVTSRDAMAAVSNIYRAANAI